MGRELQIADLFCGAGGTSTGALQACEALGLRARLVAVNHWPLAVESHAANHPGADHHCVSLDHLDPQKAVPGGRLDLLWASPECTHHSRARGGRPNCDQSRSSAWLILKWLQELRVDRLIVENVPEFMGWGPLDQRTSKPLKSKKGEIFRAWVGALRAMGYRLHWNTLTAADYGDATSRQRFFLMARRDRVTLDWPLPSHARQVDGADLFDAERRPWRPAAEVIDWSLPCPSIFMTQDEATAWAKAYGVPRPKRPLAEKTMARIAEGVRRFVLNAKEPFLVMPGHGCERFRGQGVSEPLRTQGRSNRFGLVEPFVMPIDHQSSDGPGAACGIPLSTVTTKNRHALVAPWMIKHYGGVVGTNLRNPVPSITTSGAQCQLGVAWLQRYFGTSVGMDLREPHPTILQSPGHSALTLAFLTKYYGSSGQNQSLHAPLDTVTTGDRFGLATVMIDGEPWQIVDIGMRMLQPHELAAAHSFPAHYHFAGSKSDQVAQIGNSVPVRTAQALCQTALGGAA